MRHPYFEQLRNEGLLSQESFDRIKQQESGPFSVHWELKTLLYAGVLMLSTGLGILVYKNIDSIGHQVILLFIALLTAGCLGWCDRHKAPFQYEKVVSPNAFFDYMLLLGTLSFLTFVGYLQFQYEVFGNRYGLATFIPMVVLFFLAYYFDHLGILTLAITNLALWMGVTVTPKELLSNTDFDNETIIYTYLLLGLLLLAAAYASTRLHIKSHFFFSYHHYGVHLTFIALLAAYFHYDFGASFLWLALLLVVAWLLYRRAYRTGSFYFLLLCVLYSYIGLSGLAVRTLIQMEDLAAAYLIFIYFIGSGIGLILFLSDLNKSLKRHDHL
ncbi:DUF2157 domain-containing protein [Pedobacter sp. SYSU D00535]|uniref:DUF2157 domain-containing protein n=1 Tax=Pedobacter sp. SYSU D00535 TaxID=2810308 RepID=UPI001A96C162|nr:DUF2157 domain-containing protein [Pedobacter sp. SYSU D00535]